MRSVESKTNPGLVFGEKEAVMRGKPIPDCFLAVGVLLLPALVCAQDVVKSFDQLSTALKVGDKVSVTDTGGREVTGKVLTLDAASITIDGAVRTALEANDVLLVQRRTKSVGRASLLGLLAGGVAGAVWGASASSGCTSDCTGGAWAIGAAIAGGVGAGVAAAVRAVLPAGRREIYRAPEGRAGTKVSVGPIVTSQRKGVAVSFSF